MTALAQDERNGFDRLSILLHWSIALLTITLFTLGVWMVDLDYYDNWYYTAPWWHKGLGVMVFALVLSRYCWTHIRRTPFLLASIPHWQQFLAKFVHILMNCLVLILGLTGYLIVTLKGDGLAVFDWFTIPSLLNNSDWVDIAGEFHEWSAYLLIGLAVFHAIAALKHHFVDKDVTLLRILRIRKGEHQ